MRIKTGLKGSNIITAVNPEQWFGRNWVKNQLKKKKEQLEFTEFLPYL